LCCRAADGSPAIAGHTAWRRLDGSAGVTTAATCSCCAIASPTARKGYPGNLDVVATYRVAGLQPRRQCDGAGSAQLLQVPAAGYLPVSEELVPLGHVAEVAGRDWIASIRGWGAACAWSRRISPTRRTGRRSRMRSC